MTSSLDAALKDADALLLLVAHTQFKEFKPAEIAKQTSARVLVDTVNCWDKGDWQIAGFDLFCLGVRKS
jgi:UDP-N-acetyl-D-mannosaminuronic acid dehydrogenase